AAAATVTGNRNSGAVVVRDRHGERNRLEVLSGRTVVIRDRRPLTAAGSCRRVRARAVRCRGDVLDVRIYAGTGDDRVELLTGDVTLSVHAGPGDDRVEGGGWLRGGRGADVLRGRPGRDLLLGGAGDDRLIGGPGDDHLDGDARIINGRREGAAGDDVLAGGPGRDAASWEQRRTRVTVDLGRGTASSAQDADRLRSIEDATGGLRGDRIVGDAGRNRLVGSSGRDVLVGLADDDRIDVTDRGLVLIDDPDGAVDRLECGDGDDLVVGAYAGTYDRHTPEVLGPECERLTDVYRDLYGMVIRVQPLRVRGRRVRIPVVCTLEVSACRRRVTLYARGERLARSRFVRVRSGVASVTVRLRRPLPAGGVIDVRTRGKGDYALRYRLRRVPAPSS
ncbi:MAG TPA: calcium-binding protein, partial [Solirubrobacteraceae bacterium]|nr:calcium-binding protein [Solirubrobacteraceae bacterium]